MNVERYLDFIKINNVVILFLLYRFTTKYVSPGLQKHELQSLSKTQTSHGNMEVRVYSGVSEVSVVYHVDEFSIELFVRLPEAYPLQPPAIREGKRVRVDQAQWRKWLLQLTIFVTNQVRSSSCYSPTMCLPLPINENLSLLNLQ